MKPRGSLVALPPQKDKESHYWKPSILFLIAMHMGVLIFV